MEAEKKSDKEELIKNLEGMGFSNEKAENAYNKSEDKSIEGLIQWLENHPNEEISEEKKGQGITHLVNQEFTAMLISMGYSKNVSEKSLLFTNNKSVEKSLDWINEHKNDEDFEEELRIENEEAKVVETLSKVEAAQKAAELQKKLREVRKKKEEEEALERERNRIRGGKEMNEAKRLLEEAQIKRDIEWKVKQKKEDELYKQKLLLELQRDKELRFGKKAGEISKSSGMEMEKSPFEKFQLGLIQIKTAHPPNLFPEMAKTGFKTLKVYLENILKNPDEMKFRKINLNNETFKKRLGNLVGGIYCLNSLGFFEDNDGFLILKNVDKTLMEKCLQCILKEI